MTDTSNALQDIASAQPAPVQGITPAAGDPPTTAGTDKMTDATKELAHGEKVIMAGNKISNAALRKFVYMYRFGKKMSEHDILELVMALDEAVETGLLNNDRLDELKKDPTILSDKK